VRPGELLDEMQNFFVRQNCWKAFGAFGAGEQDGLDLFVEDFAVEEEYGAESLALCGCGDSALGGEVGEKGIDLSGAHVFRMALIVKEDEAAGPIHVGFFRAVGVVFEADGIAYLIEEFFCHGA